MLCHVTREQNMVQFTTPIGKMEFWALLRTLHYSDFVVSSLTRDRDAQRSRWKAFQWQSLVKLVRLWGEITWVINILEPQKENRAQSILNCWISIVDVLISGRIVSISFFRRATLRGYAFIVLKKTLGFSCEFFYLN